MHQSSTKPLTTPSPHRARDTAYRCPDCLGELDPEPQALCCPGCGNEYAVNDGIIDFRSAGRDYYFNPVPPDRMQTIIEDMSPQTWAKCVREFLLAMPRFNADWLDNLVADGRYAWKYQLDLDAQKRVLDLGCGLGNLTSNIAPHVAKVYALDLTMRRLEFSRERIRIFNPHDDVEFLAAGDRTHLPFADGALDCVILSGVLEWVGEGDTSSFETGGRWERVGRMLKAHFGDTNPRQIQLRFLREIRRVLAPDGQLFIGIENRLNYEYFTGRPDHHSRLKYGSLLPRFAATLYSLVRNRAPYRTFTYSLGGYRKLLRHAGFQRHDFWGLSRGYSHLEEIQPADVDMNELRPGRPGSWKERLKRHPYFVPAYGIVADNRAGRPSRMQDRVLAAVTEQLAGTLGAGQLTLSRYLITPKDKLHIFATHGDVDILIKIPCNRAASRGEAVNADMLRVLEQTAIPGVPAPRPLARGRVDATDYFVEQRLRGAPLAATPEQLGAVLTDVGRLLDALAGGEASDAASESLDEACYESEVLEPLAVVSDVLPADLASGLRRRLEATLRGRELRRGICHGDMGINNILADGGRISGLIDWEGGRTHGLCLLDSLSFVLSMRLAGPHPQRLPSSVPELASGTFRTEQERSFVESRFRCCATPMELLAPLVHLTWLRMIAQHLRYGLDYDPRALDERVVGVARALSKV